MWNAAKRILTFVLVALGGWGRLVTIVLGSGPAWGAIVAWFMKGWSPTTHWVAAGLAYATLSAVLLLTYYARTLAEKAAKTASDAQSDAEKKTEAANKAKEIAEEKLAPKHWSPKEALAVLVNRESGAALVSYQEGSLEAHIQLRLFNRTPFTVKLVHATLDCSFSDELCTFTHDRPITDAPLQPGGRSLYAVKAKGLPLSKGRMLPKFSSVKVRGALTLSGPWEGLQRHDVSTGAWTPVIDGRPPQQEAPPNAHP